MGRFWYCVHFMVSKFSCEIFRRNLFEFNLGKLSLFRYLNPPKGDFGYMAKYKITRIAGKVEQENVARGQVKYE